MKKCKEKYIHIFNPLKGTQVEFYTKSKSLLVAMREAGG